MSPSFNYSVSPEEYEIQLASIKQDYASLDPETGQIYYEGKTYNVFESVNDLGEPIYGIQDPVTGIQQILTSSPTLLLNVGVPHDAIEELNKTIAAMPVDRAETLKTAGKNTVFHKGLGVADKSTPV